MTRGLILLMFLFVATSCQTTDTYPIRGSKSFVVEYRYEDSPQQNKILLYFHNTSKKPICFGPENWPERGILLNPGGEVALEVAGQKYFLGPENDYCPRCNKKVAPGEMIQDYFEYKLFGLKKELELSDKKLHFSPVGFSCR